jgi:hypothetical protein
MKNQYLGDIGDFGKYGLLRFLSSKGLVIGVNWYLTPNDGGPDGRYTDYLSKNENRKYDEELFDLLQTIARNPDKNLGMAEVSKLIPNAVLFDRMLKPESAQKIEDRRKLRREGHAAAMNTLKDAMLIFADPDNGLSEKSPGSVISSKYAFPTELADYYRREQDVVYYCHKGRRTMDAWNDARMEMKKQISECSIFTLTFHRGTQRSYIFVIHPEKREYYTRLIKEFLETPWKELFTEEYLKMY